MSANRLSDPNLWDSEPSYIGGNAFNLLILTFVLCCVLAFYHRRNCFPIQGRGYDMVIGTNVLCMAQMINTSIRGPTMPCLAEDLLHTLFSHGALAVYVWRLGALLIQNDISRSLMLHPDAADSETGITRPRGGSVIDPRGWRFRRSLMNRTKFFMCLLAYWLVAIIIVLSVAYNIGRPYGCEEILPLVSMGLLLVWSLPVLSSFWWKLRRYPPDGRHVKTEFKVIAVLVVVGTCTYLVVKLATGEIYPGVYFFGVISLGVGADSCLFPVILTYSYNRFVSKEEKTLDDLLSSQEGIDAFLAFLKTEFSAENLIFWVAVREYKQPREVADRNDLLKDARRLRDLFIVNYAPYQINVSFGSSAKVLESLARDDLQAEDLQAVFDKMEGEVFALMRRDPFPRFCRSDYYDKFMKDQTTGTVSRWSSRVLGRQSAPTASFINAIKLPDEEENKNPENQ